MPLSICNGNWRCGVAVVDDLERIEGLIGILVYRLQTANGDADRIQYLKHLASGVNACRHGRGCFIVASASGYRFR